MNQLIAFIVAILIFIAPNASGPPKVCRQHPERPQCQPTPTPTIRPTPTPTTVPTPTVAPTATPTIAPTATPTVAPTATPRLAFSDEFNGTSLNSIWVNPYPGPGDPGFGSNSDFMGDTRQVSVANGMATITAQRMATPSGHEYASGIIGTRYAFSQKYGTWEARIRYPAGQGVWPAFWMLAATANTPPPEIDIFEAYPAPAGAGGGSGTNYLGAGLYSTAGTEHFLYYDARGDLTGDWHIHKMVWTPTSMKFYVDDIFRGELVETSKYPTVAMYPIINLAMGVSGIYEVDSTTPNILKMDIDYVRIYAP